MCFSWLKPNWNLWEQINIEDVFQLAEAELELMGTN